MAIVVSDFDTVSEYGEIGELILKKNNPSPRIDASDFVRVETHAAPDDDTVRLATIQRVVDKNCGMPRSEPVWRVKTLLRECPMSPEEAVGLATQYARRKGIPVVLAGQD